MKRFFQLMNQTKDRWRSDLLQVLSMKTGELRQFVYTKVRPYRRFVARARGQVRFAYRRHAIGHRQAVRTLRRLEIFSVAWFLMLLTPHLARAQLHSNLDVSPGPSTGIVVQDSPGLLITDRQMISQTLVLDLSLDAHLRKIMKNVVLPSDAKVWYTSFKVDGENAVRNTLSQLESVFSTSDIEEYARTGTRTRSKRFVSAIIAGTALLSTLGAIVGTTLNVVNSLSARKLDAEVTRLKSNIAAIYDALKDQSRATDQLFSIVNQTAVIQGVQAEALKKSIAIFQGYVDMRTVVYTFMEPVNRITANYMMELAISLHELKRAQIPTYLVSPELVRQILGAVYQLETTPIQLKTAMDMGSAMLLHVDVQRMFVSFVINLPLISMDKVYLHKRIVNVGVWKNDTYIKVHTPKVIAFQTSTEIPRPVYLVPNMEKCTQFKNGYYLCKGRPFVPNANKLLCGLQAATPRPRDCEFGVSRPKYSDFHTVAYMLKDRWLISTRLKDATYTVFESSTETIPLPLSIFYLTVPKNAQVVIGDMTFYYLPTEDMPTQVEEIDTFTPQEVVINEDLEYLLQMKANHTFEAPVSTLGVGVPKYMFSPYDLELLRTPRHDVIEYSVQGAVVTCLVFGQIFTLILVLLNWRDRRKRARMERTSKRSREVIPLEVVEAPPPYLG